MIFRLFAPLLFAMTLAAPAVQAESLPAVNPLMSLRLKEIVQGEALNYATLEGRGQGAYSFGKDEYGASLSLGTTADMTVKNGAISSELAVNYPFKEGETLRYSWRMRIPEGFVSDAPANRWWLLARWNAQANPKLGENPDDFAIYNPAMMFGYRQIDGKDTINISYGVPETLVAGSFGIKRGQWVKFTVEITWSRSDHGKATIYINNSKLPEREITGPNMYTRYQTMFRLGINRSADIKSAAAIEIGDVTVERVTK